jgi:uncharacterized membrane protein
MPTSVYGAVQFCSAIAYRVLQGELVRAQEPGSKLASALGGDFKGKLSIALYAAAVALAFVASWMAFAVYITVALIWLVPDPRLESKFYR